MYSLRPSKSYRKALKRLVRSGQFDIRRKLETVLNMLVSGEPLSLQYDNHPLQGKYVGCFECHIKSDVLLIYEIDEVEKTLTVVDIGSHSDLFR